MTKGEREQGWEDEMVKRRMPAMTMPAVTSMTMMHGDFHDAADEDHAIDGFLMRTAHDKYAVNS